MTAMDWSQVKVIRALGGLEDGDIVLVEIPQGVDFRNVAMSFQRLADGGQIPKLVTIIRVAGEPLDMTLVTEEQLSRLGLMRIPNEDI